MTRLARLLLAGTLVPTLLLPTLPAFAQAPDQGGERHPKRERAEGGEHGPGMQRGEPGGMKGEGKKAEGRHERQGAPAHEAGESGGMKSEHRGADAGDGARRNRQGAEAGAPDAARGRDDKHGQDANRETKRGDDTKRERRQMQGDAGAKTPRGQARDDAPPAPADRDTPRRAGRPDPDRMGGGERGPNDRGPGDRMRAGDRDRGPGDRGPDARGPGDRGPGDGMRNDDARRPDAPDGRRLGRQDRDDRGPGAADRRPGPGVGVAVGVGAAAVGAGFAGGFLAPTGARRLDDVRRDRREVREGNQTFIREPGRTIVQENGRAFIVHDENDRFRALGLDVRRERRGADFVDTVRRPNGEVILTFTDGTGRLLRRVRRNPDGREFVLIDNGVGGRIGRYAEDVVDLPPPPIRIPRDRYIVDYRDADAGLLYDTLIAPPLVAPPRRYTLDQIRYSPDIRSYVRSVDINTINFATGSWDVPQEAGGKLEALATAINRAVDRNPNAVFLVEGYTDAVGNADDNLSLSDRRAQSVAEILTRDFKVPPENLTTQGYGEQNLKEQTDGPSAVNRRVVVRNITQLLASGGAVSGQ